MNGWQGPPRRQGLVSSLRGSERRVGLPADQQSRLNSIDRALEARDPRLASVFATFTVLTRDEGARRVPRAWHRGLAGSLHGSALLAG